MTNKIISTAIAALCCLSLSAQNPQSDKRPEITFDENTFDFGVVKEESNSVSHVFSFTNTGNEPLVLSSVKASCGCTTPQWSREPVAPGGKGTILVKYSTAGRPGAFTKTVTVSSNAPRKVITIKGTVTPKGQKIENVYPIEKGDIRLKSDLVNFGDVTSSGNKSATFAIANKLNEPVTLTFVNLPKHISAEPKKLNANEWTNMTITFDATKINDWGDVNNELTFVTDKNNQKQTIRSKANIIEKFTNEQRANAPIIVAENVANIGDVAAGKKVKKYIEIKNEGKSSLLIRKAVVTTGNGIEVKAPKKIDAGKTAKLQVIITNNVGKVTNISGNVKLITNDPVHTIKNIQVNYNAK